MVNIGDIVTHNDRISNTQQQVEIINYDNNQKTAVVRPEGSVDPKDNFICPQSELTLEIGK
ncbi:protein of unknown function [Tenacibaculum sp. 190524A02b]|uniref:hypothetical protein n=1 Tax=Tenacibaculum vairaonense TaxID=3137860 RepID=UPI0032B1A7D9